MAKPSWITIGTPSGSNNGESQITAASYTGRQQRSGVITGQTTGGAQDTTSVVQNGKAEFISIGTLSYEANAAGQVISISGSSNSANLKITPGSSSISGVTYSLSVAGEPDESWNGNSDTGVDGDPGATAEYSFVISVTVPENQSESGKSLKFTVENSNGDVTTSEITITQAAGVKNYAAPVISSFSYPSENIPASGGSKNPTLTYSQTWGWNSSTTNGGTLQGTLAVPVDGTTFLFDGATSETAGTVTAPSKGTAVSGVTVVAEVTAKVTLNGKSSAVYAAQTVSQAANTATYGEVTIAQTTPVSLQSAGQTYQINAGAKQTITYTSGATRTEASGDSPVVIEVSYVEKTAQTGFSLNTGSGAVTVTENPATSQRGGYVVTINASGEGSKSAAKDITFNQQGSGSTLELTPASMTFDAAGGSQTLTITSNDSWTIS